MTCDDLRAWQADMNYTQQQAAAALGVSWATYKRWLTGDPSLLAALACSAIAAGLAPYPAAPKKRAKRAVSETPAQNFS